MDWYDASHRVLPWRLNTHSKHQRDTPLATLSQQEMLYRVWVRHWQNDAASLSKRLQA